MTGDDTQVDPEPIEALPLDDRADAYRLAQRLLQDRLERPARPAEG